LRAYGDKADPGVL